MLRCIVLPVAGLFLYDCNFELRYYDDEEDRGNEFLCSRAFTQISPCNVIRKIFRTSWLHDREIDRYRFFRKAHEHTRKLLDFHIGARFNVSNEIEDNSISMFLIQSESNSIFNSKLDQACSRFASFYLQNC